MLVERSVMEQRFEAVMVVVRDGLPVTEVAARFGVSRQSLHSWIRRYEMGALTALEDRSHRPFGCPHQMAPAVEAELSHHQVNNAGFGLFGTVEELSEESVRTQFDTNVFGALGVAQPVYAQRLKTWEEWAEVSAEAEASRG